MAQGKRIRIWKFVVFAAVMACGALAVGVCVAKMTDDINAEASEVQIARWSVSSNSEDGTMTLIAGGDMETLDLEVINDSEVATSYVISLSGIPDGVMVGVDDGELQAPDANGAIEFTNDSYALNIQDHKTESHILKFAATLTADTEVVSGEDVVISGEDIVIDVLFTQRSPQ